MTSLKEQPSSIMASSPHPKYRPDIDGLRAIAVLAVVFFHAFPSKIKGGFVGVDVFFVISGFLISSIIMASLKNNTFNLVDFYSRRINRIFPALLIVMISIWFFSLIALFPQELEQLGKHMLGGATFISNFLLLDEVGYFDRTSDTKLLLHLWSLGVEEQFYLIWPIILLTCWRLKLNLITSILTLGFISFTANAYFVITNPSLDFYAPHTRFWELLFGASLAYLTSKPTFSFTTDSESRRKFCNALSFIGLFLILISVKFISKRYMFPGWWALFPVAGASMIIYAGPDSWVNKKLLSNRLMVAIGLISFPLYLWHWPLLALAREMNGDTTSASIRLAIVALSFALAWLTYKFVELPLRRNKRKHTQSIVLAGLMTVTGVAGALTWISGGYPDRENIKWSGAVFSQLVGSSWAYTKNEYCLDNYRKPHELDSYQWYFCYASKKSPPDILLVGNSYANHIIAGLSANTHTKGNSILSIGTCGADIAPESASPAGRFPCSGTRISDQTNIIKEIIENSPTLKFAILSGLDNKTNSSLIKTAKEKIDFYESKGAQVIVFTPHIKINYDIKSCYGRPFLPAIKDCKIDKQSIIEYGAQFQPFIDQISKSNPNVKFFDVNSLFCENNQCSFMKDGLPLLRDDASHLSEFGSIVMSNLFVEWAKTNAPTILTK